MTRANKAFVILLWPTSLTACYPFPCCPSSNSRPFFCYSSLLCSFLPCSFVSAAPSGWNVLWLDSSHHSGLSTNTTTSGKSVLATQPRVKLWRVSHSHPEIFSSQHTPQTKLSGQLFMGCVACHSTKLWDPGGQRHCLSCSPVPRSGQHLFFKFIDRRTDEWMNKWMNEWA